MGLILDSSVLIAGERRRESVRDILERVREKAHGNGKRALGRNRRGAYTRNLSR